MFEPRLWSVISFFPGEFHLYIGLRVGYLWPFFRRTWPYQTKCLFFNLVICCQLLSPFFLISQFFDVSILILPILILYSLFSEDFPCFLANIKILRLMISNILILVLLYMFLTKTGYLVIVIRSERNSEFFGKNLYKYFVFVFITSDSILWIIHILKWKFSLQFIAVISLRPYSMIMIVFLKSAILLLLLLFLLNTALFFICVIIR